MDLSVVFEATVNEITRALVKQVDGSIPFTTIEKAVMSLAEFGTYEGMTELSIVVGAITVSYFALGDELAECDPDHVHEVDHQSYPHYWRISSERTKVFGVINSITNHRAESTTTVSEELVFTD